MRDAYLAFIFLSGTASKHCIYSPVFPIFQTSTSSLLPLFCSECMFSIDCRSCFLCLARTSRSISSFFSVVSQKLVKLYTQTATLKRGRIGVLHDAKKNSQTYVRASVLLVSSENHLLMKAKSDKFDDLVARREAFMFSNTITNAE